MNDLGKTTLEEQVSEELKELLSELRNRHWTLLIWGGKKMPELIASMFKYLDSAVADVLLLRSRSNATAYRVPAVDGASVFNPERVMYQYHATALWTLRALLSLPAPGKPGAPIGFEHPMPECFIPDGLPPPMIIRPLSPFQ